jgi:peptide/nickel transport system substrate-binding protein
MSLGMLAGACGDSGGEADGGGSSPATTAGQPVRGGTLTFGTYSEPRGLDPIVSTGFGVTGGIELSALYDTLVGYDTKTTKYTMRTAESLTPNATFSEWTLKLRAGITFGDGTAYDAAAVKFNIERHQSAKNTTTSRVMSSYIAKTDVVDPLTVRFTLTQPWAGFPFVLADRVGMIVSPAAVQKLGDDLPKNPVGAGAGPFQIVSFNPKESIVMKRNDGYWGGDVYLDGLKFVNLVGASETYEALKAGTIDAAFMREPKVVKQAKADGFDGYENIQQAGQILLMNNGLVVECKGGQPAACAGQPDGTKITPKVATADKRVRQAVAAAIDPKVIDQRENDGTGSPGTGLFQSTFPWDPAVAGPAFDLARAKSLVAEAKSSGWDGKLRFNCDNAPAAQARALAIKTMLEAAGIEVALANVTDVSGTIAAVITRKDFELACWGISIPGDDGAVFQVSYAFLGTSAANRTGYKNPAMDAALTELMGASGDDARKAAYGKVATLYAEDVPFLSLQAVPEYIAWRPAVHGVVPNQATQAFFDKAWIAG